MKTNINPTAPSALRHLLQALPKALLALALAAACTASPLDGLDAPGTATPISFGATLLQPAGAGATRATTQGRFAQGDRIALRIDGQVKPYTYDAAADRFTSPDPFYWPAGATSIDDVLAWYPYSEELPLWFSPSTSQHDDAEHAASDFLSTGSVTLTRASAAAPGSLTFAHRTAQLVFRIKADPITLNGVAEITGVTLNGVLPTAEVDRTHGTLKQTELGMVPGPITAHLRSAPSTAEPCYEALIVPQQKPALGASSLSVTITTSGGKTFKGDLPILNFEGGMSYPFNITLIADRITITPATGGVPWEEGVAAPDGYDLTVSNAEELKRFAELVNSWAVIPGTDVRANYARVLQTADIDLAGIGNWTPIGNWGNNFRGAYNGNGYTISKLTINEDVSYNGLFGYVRGIDATFPAVLTGIHLREVKIAVNSAEGDCYSGTIAGCTENAVISFCSAQGEISATAAGSENSTGGIIGLSQANSVINHCRADVKVKAHLSSSSGDCCAGGIAGNNWGTILACEASGSSVSAEGEKVYAGGITGWNRPAGNIYFCAAQKGEISVAGTRWIYAGGLTGYQDGELHASYARGEAKAAGATSSYAGAITGRFKDYSYQSYCIGLGEGGKGTSGLDAGHGLADNIDYNTSATDGYIFKLVSRYPKPVTIKTTTYVASRFPAYGIELTEQKFRATGAGQGEFAVWDLLATVNGGKIRLRNLPPISAAP